MVGTVHVTVKLVYDTVVASSGPDDVADPLIVELRGQLDSTRAEINMLTS